MEIIVEKGHKRMRRTVIIAIAAIAFILVVAGITLLPGCSQNPLNSKRGYSGKMETITVGTAPLESSALIYIAERQGFFSRNGLDVTIKNYDTGAASLNGLLKGEVDIATPAEYAMVGKAFKREKTRAIASIDKAEYFYLIGRKDRGIKSIADLRGKKIGVVRKTTAEFYLGRFLEVNGVSINQVTLVDIDISKSADVITNGDVDAIISRPPHLGTIEKQLGVNAVIWPAQSDQALYAIMVGKNNWITEHPELLKRLLSSLAQAEEYLIHNPTEAKAIVQKRLKFDDTYIASVWSQNQFALSLDQSLVLAMEDEARWVINNNLTTETAIPDFSNYIYVDGLKEIKPEAVNIIR